MGGRGGHLPARRGYCVPVGQQLTGVLEENDPIAQQAPALLRMSSDNERSFAVQRGARGTPRFVHAHLFHTPKVRPAVGA
jgi:hypothetical protein